MFLNGIWLLQFDEYLLAVEEVAEGVVDEDEGEGVGHGGPFQGRDDGMEDGVDGVVDAETGEEDGEELAEDIEGEGIDSKDLELGVHSVMRVVWDRLLSLLPLHRRVILFVRLWYRVQEHSGILSLFAH